MPMKSEVSKSNQPIDCGGFGGLHLEHALEPGALEAPGLCPHNGSAGPGGGDYQPPGVRERERYIQPCTTIKGKTILKEDGGAGAFKKHRNAASS